MNKFSTRLIIMSLAVFIAIIWVIRFMNIAIDNQFIPTMINGITASTSIIVGLSGTIIGVMVHDGNQEPKARKFYIFALALLLFPISNLWSTYIFLSMGQNTFQYAVKYGLVGLIMSLYEFFAIILYTVKNLVP